MEFEIFPFTEVDMDPEGLRESATGLEESAEFQVCVSGGTRFWLPPIRCNPMKRNLFDRFSCPGLAGLALAFVLSGQGLGEPMFELDATRLAAGTIREWPASGTLSGRLLSDQPLRVTTLLGRQAVEFGGGQDLVSEFILPAGFEKGPFTVEAWVLNPTVEKFETLMVLAPPKGGPGTEFSFSDSATSGAFRSGFKATSPFSEVPSPGVWHHLAWTWSGGGDGALRVYVDGELDFEKPFKFVPTPGAVVHVGASGETNEAGRLKRFSGAISRLRLLPQALTQTELRQSAGLESAYAPLPPNGSVTDSLETTLRWQAGSPQASRFVVYLDRDRRAVEEGRKELAKPAASTELAVSGLTVGAGYFWRVDQLDPQGRVLARGPVWSFGADGGFATGPSPRDHDSNVPATQQVLAWQPGRHATRQRVYVAASPDELDRATKPLAELPGDANRTSLSAPLAAGSRCCWRVDSDNGSQPGTRGRTWTFRTQDAWIRNDVTFFVGSDSHYGRENNASINRRVIDEMNALPGTELPASIGGGVVRTPRGVAMNGDLLDEGFNAETAHAQWAEFCRDYGLTGSDGRLCYPLFEGFGNHDGGPTKGITRAGIKERNSRRSGLTSVSPDGHHYSWDWDQVHLVQLNLFGGDGPGDVKGVNGPEHDPEGALRFLKEDLARNVGDSGRWVVVFQHFGWLGGMSDWWQPEAKERFHEVVKPYHIACLINGHSHGAAFVPWHGLLTIHDGSTARGDGDTGDFLVVRITDQELIVIQRKLGGWGIQKRMPLGAPVESPNP